MTNPPDRRTLRSTLIWSARWLLLGGNEQFRGKIRVHISSSDGSESVQFREESSSSERTPTAFRQRYDEGFFEFLVAGFLSEEEQKIVRLLTDSPKKASVLIDRAKIERSRFYVLASNLGDRKVIRAVSDGYELTSDFVTKVLEIRERQEEDGAAV
jgi:hypothetical protein